MRPTKATVVEVGPRDGLQNESEPVTVEQKLEFIRLLARTGLSRIEATSFVHPRWVPQLADSDELCRRLPAVAGVTYSFLVPNLKGLERATAAEVRQIAVFTAASESFSQKNTNRSIAQSLRQIEQVAERARTAGMKVRGYVSTAFVCPYEGDIEPARVVGVCRALVDCGVEELSIGDTIGAAVPVDVERTVGALLEVLPVERLALHFHDTYGTALANVLAGLNLGISVYDASAGGLGGCPYAPGASGNLATEDLIYFLDRMGIESGVSLPAVAVASRYMAGVLGRELPSRWSNPSAAPGRIRPTRGDR